MYFPLFLDCGNKQLWFSFWLNTIVDGVSEWVQDAELDMLEQMYSDMPAHNWAGLPVEAYFAEHNRYSGHVTTIVTIDSSA